MEVNIQSINNKIVKQCDYFFSISLMFITNYKHKTLDIYTYLYVKYVQMSFWGLDRDFKLEGRFLLASEMTVIKYV